MPPTLPRTTPRPSRPPPPDPDHPPAPVFTPFPPEEATHPQTHAPPDTQTQAEPHPDPQTDGQTETDNASMLEDDPQCQKCPQCAARTLGSSVVHTYGNVEAAARRGYAYQHFVCPWHVHIPDSNMIEEWRFNGVDFDGLHPTECHLYEAKHGYDGFLEDSYTPTEQQPYGTPQLREWADAAGIYESVFVPMLRQARRQHLAVSPHFGDVALTWVFSHMITRLYVGALLFEDISGWYHELEVRPFQRRGNE